MTRSLNRQIKLKNPHSPFPLNRILRMTDIDRSFLSILFLNSTVSMDLNGVMVEKVLTCKLAGNFIHQISPYLLFLFHLFQLFFLSLLSQSPIRNPQPRNQISLSTISGSSNQIFQMKRQFDGFGIEFDSVLCVVLISIKRKLSKIDRRMLSDPVQYGNNVQNLILPDIKAAMYRKAETASP